MFRTILLELFLPFRPFKETVDIWWTTISAQILTLHENKTKWRVASKRQRGAAAKHLLKPLTAQRCSHGLWLNRAVADARLQLLLSVI